MKILTSTFLLFLTSCLFAQKNMTGRYRDYFGSRIELNKDSTFRYTWNFDLSGSWTKGTWTFKNDTLYLNMIPTYDTLSRTNNNCLAKDTLILSSNETAERISVEQAASMALSGGGQNRRLHPDKLVFKKGRLYEIRNGRLVTKRQKDLLTGKKWAPWYSKSGD